MGESESQTVVVCIIQRAISMSNGAELSRWELRLENQDEFHNGKRAQTCSWGCKRSLATAVAGSKT